MSSDASTPRVPLVPTIPAAVPRLDDASVRALLDDIFWQAMQGAQQHFTEGNAVARRYAHGFSPIVAFADREHPDFAALAPVCEVGERFYCDSWTGPAQPGWEIALESTMLRMVWDAPMPDADPAEDAIAAAAVRTRARRSRSRR